MVAGGILYLIGVGFYSVIPRVFSPPASELPASVTCARGVETLRVELLDRAAERVRTGGEADPSALRRWLRDWDGRYHALAPRCGAGEQARWALLGRLRYRLQGTLERYDREDGELARAIQHTST
ncbi:MAG: hypothetical protein KF729_17910 [Sandaracinaceae bacterium]|nr:hypothetical protein [Sandaracinaceae bacterium]